MVQPHQSAVDGAAAFVASFSASAQRSQRRRAVDLGGGVLGAERCGSDPTPSIIQSPSAHAALSHGYR